eukprot:6910966-Prymnesium_polylepis.1
MVTTESARTFDAPVRCRATWRTCQPFICCRAYCNISSSFPGVLRALRGENRSLGKSKLTL